MLGISLVGFVAIELLMVSIFLTLNYVKYFILERIIYSYMLNLTCSFSMLILVDVKVLTVGMSKFEWISVYMNIFVE